VESARDGDHVCQWDQQLLGRRGEREGEYGLHINVHRTGKLHRIAFAGAAIAADVATHAWSSAVNNALVPVRLWQVAENTKDGARCGVERYRRNGIVRPFHVARQFSFHTAEGLGGL
jgi:hypothetical protein